MESRGVVNFCVNMKINGSAEISSGLLAAAVLFIIYLFRYYYYYYYCLFSPY